MLASRTIPAVLTLFRWSTWSHCHFRWV